jgi:hypothetical protein
MKMSFMNNKQLAEIVIGQNILQPSQADIIVEEL